MSRPRHKVFWGLLLLVGLALMGVSGVCLAQGPVPAPLSAAPTWLQVAAGVLGTLVTAIVSVSVAALQISHKISNRITKEVADLREHVTNKVNALEAALRVDLAPAHRVDSLTSKLTSVNAGLDKLAGLDPPSQRECRELHAEIDATHATLRERLAVLEARVPQLAPVAPASSNKV